MGVEQEEKIIKDATGDKKGFSVTFTNGALQQLEELQTYFKVSDKLEALKLGISLLQKAKDVQENIQK